MQCQKPLVKNPHRVIVDVDVGTDDYLALLILLQAEKEAKLKIEAITCTMGNTSVDNVCENVLRLLELIDRTDIPVYRGASKALIPAKPGKIIPFHGSDGFGDLPSLIRPDLSVIKRDIAAVAIKNIITGNPGEISLISIGPLTNLALAIKLSDSVMQDLKDLWIMGGNYTARGNTTSTAEYNFYVDPEAAYIVLENIKKPTYILTYEGCLLPQITLEWFCNIMGAKDATEILLLVEAERAIYMRKNKSMWKSCDAFLAAAFVDPEKFILRKSLHHATVELNGKQTRGQMVVDHLKKNTPNITIIEEIDTDRFKELLIKL